MVTALIVLAIIALACAILLTLSATFFAVKENEKVVAVRDCLPGANCGACGYSGCDGYAKALGEGQTDNPSLCTPGGADVAAQLADIMGLAAGDVAAKVAYVACNGSCKPEQRKYVYDGIKTCVASKTSYAGDRECTYACLGYGDCVAVCPKDAIVIDPDKGIAQIDPAKCIGCGLCEKACPNSIIHLVNDTTRVLVKCSSHDKGAVVRKFCPDGCIGCMKCQKTCPEGAIKVENNLAVIDYDKCTGCGACHDVCPVKCIHLENLVCGTHL
ncbi:MAG: RnfABCDGE type electron transport complex subunit B [Clostridia bacterium]|nr:RnfABCDGE type electron transport complex subunit B [Clostridia bacterium]